MTYPLPRYADLAPLLDDLVLTSPQVYPLYNYGSHYADR
jgi:hypothetical protein